MRERDRPRLAKFLSYGDNNIGSLGSQFPGYYVSQIYIPTTVATTVSNNNNNVTYPPPKPPTSPSSKRKSRSKTKAKRSQSKHLKQDQSTTTAAIFDGFPSLDTNSPPRKRRSPSKSRIRRSQSRPLQVLLDPSGGQVFSLPPPQPQEPPQSSSSPVRRGRSRSKAKVKRTLSIASVSNVENEPPVFSPPPSDSPTPADKHSLAISANNENNISPASGGGGKKSRNRNKLKIRRSQSEAPHRAINNDGGGKSLWEDITQAKENIQSYIYKSTGQGKPPPGAAVVTNDRCLCNDNIYPQYPVLANLNSRGRSKSRSRRSVVSSTTAGPYSLGSSPYVAPREANGTDLPASGSPTPASNTNNVTSISVPGVGVRGRSKSRSRLSASITNGMSTVWPDSRGAWLPV